MRKIEYQNESEIPTIEAQQLLDGYVLTEIQNHVDGKFLIFLLTAEARKQEVLTIIEQRKKTMLEELAIQDLLDEGILTQSDIDLLNT